MKYEISNMKNGKDMGMLTAATHISYALLHISATGRSV